MAFKANFILHSAILSIFSILLALSPLVIASALFFTALRALLSIYKWAFKPSYGPFLSGVNNFFSRDCPYETPRAIVVVRLSTKEHITMEEVEELLLRKLYEFENPIKESSGGQRGQGGQPWFPELKQYPTSWMGFAVLKNEAHFQLKDHLTKLEDIFPDVDLAMTPDSISEVTLRLSRTPFKRRTSPWQVVLWHNPDPKSKRNQEDNEEEGTIGFIRLHHTLGDGLSLVKLLSGVFDFQDNFDGFLRKFSKSLTSPVAQRNKIASFCHTLWHHISLPILGLYEFSAVLVQSWDQNEWHHGPPTFRRNFYLASNDSIPIDKIKRIRKMRGGVRFSTVVTTTLAASLRKFMLRRGVKVPPAIHAAVAIPIPKKSTNLSNNVTSGFATIPTGMSRRSEMLRVVEEVYNRTKSSRHPAFIYALLNLVNTFPRCLLANYWIFTTAIMSNVPGIDGTIGISGKSVTKVHGFVIAPNSTSGIYLTSVGYGGKLFITLALSHHIVGSHQEVKEICGDFLHELDLLEEPNCDLIDPAS